ncbi:MAG: hypothetical protein EHM36_08215, partial [Deltaproteobacteria bacterium]
MGALDVLSGIFAGIAGDPSLPQRMKLAREDQAMQKESHRLNMLLQNLTLEEKQRQIERARKPLSSLLNEKMETREYIEPGMEAPYKMSVPTGEYDDVNWGKANIEDLPNLASIVGILKKEAPTYKGFSPGSQIYEMGRDGARMVGSVPHKPEKDKVVSMGDGRFAKESDLMSHLDSEKANQGLMNLLNYFIQNNNAEGFSGDVPDKNVIDIPSVPVAGKDVAPPVQNEPQGPLGSNQNKRKYTFPMIDVGTEKAPNWRKRDVFDEKTGRKTTITEEWKPDQGWVETNKDISGAEKLPGELSNSDKRLIENESYNRMKGML